MASAIKRTEHNESCAMGEGTRDVTGGILKGGQQGGFDIRLEQGD